MLVKVGGIREPVFPPGAARVRIVRVDEPLECLGYRDTWVLRYVCLACRDHYADFRNRYSQQEAEDLVRQVDDAVPTLRGDQPTPAEQ
jgi:hypothetical protein